jgi:hypothetical protein
MLKRKILTLFISTISSIILIASYFTLVEGEGLLAIFPMTIFVSLIAIPAILLYGLPIHLLSEKLTSSFSSIYRIVWSFLIHIIFGVSFVFIVGLLFETQILLTNFNSFWKSYEIIFIASIGISVCFWLVDEGLKYCNLRKMAN